jgi:hypothetical protein
MYKLGPLHQGILERGSKTGSSSYLLWPCRIAPFTAVVGKHYSNFDTSDFPFSYITEEEGKSFITPAMNLFTVGTRRDSEKWPNRDRRKDPDKLDLIHFDLFSPYIAQKLVKGIETLNDLYANTPKKVENAKYNGIYIKRLLLRTCRKYYELALKIYIGNELAKQLEKYKDVSDKEELSKKLKPSDNEGLGTWADISGMLTPVQKLNDILEEIRTGKVNSINSLRDNLKIIFDCYDNYAWNWCYTLLKEKNDFDISLDSSKQLIKHISDWKNSLMKLNNMILKDAEKEFDISSKIGFGIDGDEKIRDMDFEAVRGTYDDNKFIKGLREETDAIAIRADKLIVWLESI